MRHRWFVSVMGMLLLSCAGPAHLRETVARPRVAARGEASEEGAVPERKASRSASRKPRPEATRDAKAAFNEAPPLEDESVPERDAFAGVAVEPPDDSAAEPQHHSVAVRGIEGTMSEYDVRTTLENQAKEFDACHDRNRGGSGSIEFRIHILSDGEVGTVKVHRSNVRARELVDCYSDVVTASRFTAPHGGYADVTWTTKVGRSRARPDALFERKVRWDAPTGGASTQHAETSASRRERRHARRHHK